MLVEQKEMCLYICQILGTKSVINDRSRRTRRARVQCQTLSFAADVHLYGVYGIAMSGSLHLIGN